MIHFPSLDPTRPRPQPFPQPHPNPKTKLVHLRTHIHAPLGQAMLANVATLARDPSRLLFLLGHLRDNVELLKREPGLLEALAAARILLATEVNASNYEQV